MGSELIPYPAFALTFFAGVWVGVVVHALWSDDEDDSDGR